MSRDENSHRNRQKAAIEHNARAWDRLAREQAALTRPAQDDEFREPLRQVDPLGWLGGSIAGLRVLCLAAGGGKHSVLYAAAGARVTVVDISAEMLALDREVAIKRGLKVEAIQGSMDDLSMLPPASFDIVIHPVSTCYVPDVASVFAQVASVTRPRGLYVSQHKTPTSLQADVELQGSHYGLREPYYREGPLPSESPCRVRERGTHEFLHRWEQLIGGMCRAGFVIEDLVEPLHADDHADSGSFAHRSCYVAPYVRIKARRNSEQQRSSSIELV